MTTAPIRHPNATLAAAAEGQTRKGTTLRLLEALSAHEGDSDLGCLIGAILSAGDWYVRNSDDYEAVEDACGEVEQYAAKLTEDWLAEAQHALEAA